MDNNDGTKQTFYRRFQEEHASIDGEISNLSSLPSSSWPEAIDRCLAGISKLSDVVKDASSYLPAYDQRSYSEQVKSLSEKLSETRKLLAPKTKFSFKTKKAVKSAHIGGAVKVSPSTAASSAEQEQHSIEASNLVISEKKSTYITSPAAVSTTTASAPSLLLSSLEKCVVNLSDSNFSSAAIKNVSSSILYLGTSIDGPLHMTNIIDSLLVVGCRQFRMHDSGNTTVYLFCASRPIIEDCKRIRFAPFEFGTEAAAATATKGINLWDQVDDFKWLRSEASPNWGVVGEGERIAGSVWDERICAEVKVEDILQEFLQNDDDEI